MTSLSRKLARLETIISTQAAKATAAPMPAAARIEQWQQWATRLLQTMPEERAVVAYVELTTLPAETWGPLTVHVDRMAQNGAMGAYDAYLAQERPLALPEAVCAVLEAHPDADVHSANDCEDCGIETPVLRRERRVFLTACPLCGGAVRWQGFNDRRWRALWERQRAEMLPA